MQKSTTSKKVINKKKEGMKRSQPKQKLLAVFPCAEPINVPIQWRDGRKKKKKEGKKKKEKEYST